MLRSIPLGAVAALAFTASAAQAQVADFNFSYSVDGTPVMGTFVTTQQGVGTYLITDILNGTRGGSPITLLPTGTTFSQGGNIFTTDNSLFFPASPGYFTSSGFGYTNGGIAYNAYYDSPTKTYGEQAGLVGPAVSPGIENLRVTAVALAVPGPVAGAGLVPLVGLAGGWLARRRRRKLLAA